MKTHVHSAVAALLVCSATVAAVFLDEAALAELAEREGYAVTLHAMQRLERVRREVSQCRCPPPGPPPPFPDGDGDLPPPPPGPDGPSDDADRPQGPPQPQRGCWPPPPPGPWYPRHHHHHRSSAGEGYDGPPCELRPLFRVPDKFNMTARTTCFDRWERDSAKQMGMAPEDRFDPAKYKPTQRKSLMWNKGCDMQCHFKELELLTDDGETLAVDPEAVAGLLKEEGDSSDITAAVDAALKACLEHGADMLHARQVCQTGADEILFCLQRTLEETCPGSKWQGQRSCDEVAEAGPKLRTCWNIRRLMHPHPHPPPPPPFNGRRGPPMYMRPGRPAPGVWPPPTAPVQPNFIDVDEGKAEAQ